MINGFRPWPGFGRSRSSRLVGLLCTAQILAASAVVAAAHQAHHSARAKPAPATRSSQHAATTHLAAAGPRDGSRKARGTKETATAHAAHAAHHAAAHGKSKSSKTTAAKHKAGETEAAAAKPTASPPPNLPPAMLALREAIEAARQHKPVGALASDDPIVATLLEWVTLRSGNGLGFARYDAFMRRNPDWPGQAHLRARAEAALWADRGGSDAVARFIGDAPVSGAGRLALARSLLARGERGAAELLLRSAWYGSPLSSELESEALAAFPDFLTAADHRIRMDRRIGAKDFAAALRMAKRLGDPEIAVVKACVAAEGHAQDAPALLSAVPAAAQQDVGYRLCKLHALIRRDAAAEAVALLAGGPDAAEAQDADEWWRERRILARKLLDLGQASAAYKVVQAAALPSNPNYRAEMYFMAGWIALRYLGDAQTAATHFAHIDDGSSDPIVRARAAYWRGRAAEAAGDQDTMRRSYAAAAQFPTAYYGQLARARIGLPETPAARAGQGVLNESGREVLHAAELLYATGERELALAFVCGLSEQATDAGLLAAIGELARSQDDAQATLLVGKSALARGLGLEAYAFPAFGVPAYAPISPAIDRSIVYSIVRIESAFNQRDRSPAKAVGLMQVTREAGRDTARRFHVSYDWGKLVSDPVYNTQMGSAELSALLREYRGSYIMAFAGYNAGRGRVQEWVAKHGDPRDPKVDAVDWVERIPLSETRNYVQRVMESLAVYKARFEPQLESELVAPASSRASTAAAETSAR